MLRYEPQERDEKSPFDGRRPSRWSAMRYKVHAGARARRGRGRLRHRPAAGRREGQAPGARERRSGEPGRHPGAAGEDLRRAEVARGDRPRRVPDGRRPRPDARARACSTGVASRGTVDVRATFADAENVAGVLRGRGALADEVVVVGAHYDHLGYGGQRLHAPERRRAIHNGADDNASGTAAALLAAARLAAAAAGRRSRSPHHRLRALLRRRRSGLGGSSYFVAHPPVPLEQDRGHDQPRHGRARCATTSSSALGTESAPEWKRARSTRRPPTLKLTVSGRRRRLRPVRPDQLLRASRSRCCTSSPARTSATTRPTTTPATLNFAGAARVVAS